MKILYIKARKKIKLNKEKLAELEKILPDIISIAYSIQYEKLAEEVRNELAKNKRIKILGFSQILGCSEIKTGSSILLISSGRFHALNLALSSGREIIVFDNFSISKITRQEIGKEKQKQKGKYLKFLASDNIGIIVSSKYGQENLKLACRLKKKLISKGKAVNIFLADNINLQELENFPCEIFINTACPGLSLDSSKIINHNQLELYSA